MEGTVDLFGKFSVLQFTAIKIGGSFAKQTVTCVSNEDV